MAATKSRAGNKGATNRTGRRSPGGAGRGKASGGSSQMTTNPEEIRKIVEQKGGRPACVKGTEGRGGSCLLRIDYPGGSGEEKLEPMEWEEFNEIFEQNGLAMVYDSKPEVRFTKFVSRDGAAGKSGSGSKGRSSSKGSARSGSRGGTQSKSAKSSSARASRSQPGEKQRGRTSGKYASARGKSSGRSRASR